MSFEVLLTEDAERDLVDIYTHVADHDSPAKAEHVLDRIEKVIESLRENPGRGSYPKELAALGIRDYRQVFFKPYRIIYRTFGERVYVYLLADGRRDMETLLTQRLFMA
ncbi:MAG: type II toxin-antitoxin system RelE/ParE family toxin [Sulfurifustis sp.]